MLNYQRVNHAKSETTPTSNLQASQPSAPRQTSGLKPLRRHGIAWNCIEELFITPVAKVYGRYIYTIPSGKLTELWKITMLLMGKSTISMAMFNSYLDITRGYHRIG